MDPLAKTCAAVIWAAAGPWDHGLLGTHGETSPDSFGFMKGMEVS